MTRNLSIFLAIALLVVAGGLYVVMKPAKQAQDPGAPISATAPDASPPTPEATSVTPRPSTESASPVAGAIFEAKDSSFTVDGQRVVLSDGLSTTPAAPGSASAVITRHAGKEATGDLNNDGQEDVAFVVTRETGGSGMFYYVVAAIKAKDGYKTTNAFLVGDRVALQSIEIARDANELRVNYAKRQPGEPMAALPSVDAVLSLKVTPQGVLQGLMK